MSKIQALTEVHTLLEKQVEALVQQGQRDEASPVDQELGRLQDMRAEVLAHAEMLGYAQAACELGQAGAVPTGWEEYTDQLFDAHATVAATLDQLPGGGQFSPALLAFLDELPGQQQQAHEEVMRFLRADDRPLDEGAELFRSATLDEFNQLAGKPAHAVTQAVARQRSGGVPVDPLKQLTDQQASQYGVHVAAKYLGMVAVLTESYANDVACAIELAHQRADWAAILDYLA